MDCPSSSLFRHHFLHHKFPLVGPPPDIDLCQPARDALPRLWLLRFFLHNPGRRHPTRLSAVFHDPVETYADHQSYCSWILAP